MKIITPSELGKVDVYVNDDSEKLALINHINGYMSSRSYDNVWRICALGYFRPKHNWIELAQEVLDLFKKQGWTITDEVIFFSFQTRVEFTIQKS